MSTKTKALALLVLAFALLMPGCGGATNGKETSGKETKDEYGGEPVTLTVWNQAAGILNDNDLETFLGKPVRDKYPNISFRLITGAKLEELIAAGETPDFITTSNYYLYNLMSLELTDDLSGMIKKEAIDLSKFEPAVVDALKKFGAKGEIYGMPFAQNYGITLYNKDIFDKFGVPYPKDQMTWNDMIELSRRVTRQDRQDVYIGLDPGGVQTLVRARSLPVVDETRQKAALSTEPIKQIFSLLQNLYSIPGIVQDGGKKYSYGFDYFQKDKKLAMLPYWLAALTSRVPLLNEAGINWDIVSFPTFPDRPQYGREVDFHLIVVSKTSKNKEAAYKALKAIVSEEAQRAMNKNVRLTVLNNPALRTEFASDLKYYEGKNLAGIFKVQPSPLPMFSEYDDKLYSYLRNAVTRMVRDKVDINTALREAEEEGNKYISEQKQLK